MLKSCTTCGMQDKCLYRSKGDYCDMAFSNEVVEYYMPESFLNKAIVKAEEEVIKICSCDKCKNMREGA